MTVETARALFEDLGFEFSGQEASADAVQMRFHGDVIVELGRDGSLAIAGCRAGAAWNCLAVTIAGAEASSRRTCWTAGV